MSILKPSLVIATGISGTGKTTTLSELVRQVPNAFILEKDSVNQGQLHVSTEYDERQRLPKFEEYVKKDSVFPDFAREVETPFGKMIHVDPKNFFYARHIRDQAYLVMAEIARTNMDLDKVPVVDCMVIRQIKDGTLKTFMEYDKFRGYRVSLFHFIADEEDCFQRHVERAQRDKHAAVRDKDKISSREAFHHFVTNVQPMLPEELSQYQHYLVNTSHGTPQECAQRCLEYLASRTKHPPVVQVDDAGNIIGPIWFEEAHPKDKNEKGIRHATANTIIYSSPDKKQVLLQLRGGTAKKPDVWDCSAGGHIDWIPRENRASTPEETAYQEIDEELFSGKGIPSSMTLKKAGEFPKQTRPNDPEYVYLFESVYSGLFLTNPDEVREARFFDVDFLKQDIKQNPDKYTSSLRVYLERV